MTKTLKNEVKVQIQQEQDRFPLPVHATDWPLLSAAEYVSAFPARLALARWTRGGDIPHVYISTRHVSTRAAWYAEAERNFQAWLEDGGFHGE
jgi:hypothetical protein